jgi:glucosylceramidase
MPGSINRRTFLSLTTAGAVALSAAAPASADTPGSIAVRQTADTKRFAEAPALKWQPAAGSSAGAILLDPTRTYQEMLGFGGAHTDASAYMINELDASTREKFLRELYHPSELGLEVGRVCVGSADYAATMYSYDEGEPDPDMKRFSIDHDKAYILPQLRIARQHNPKLFLLASPWSPPGWMKSSGTMLGGSLKPRNFPAYAKYLVKFLQAYQAEGVPIDALTSQNEVDTDQDGGYPNGAFPACIWAQEHEIVFVGQHLGPALEQNKIKTKIWILDHNFDLWGRVVNTLENPLVNRYVDGVAWHPYGGSESSVNRVHDLFPDKGMYSTESGYNFLLGRPPRDMEPAAVIARMGVGAANSVRNWMKCIIVWNLVLDENGKPCLASGYNPGFITINSKTKEISRSDAYWAMKHYTHAGHRGSKRFDTQGDLEGIAHVAFVNPDDNKTVVLSNVGATRKVQLRLGSMMTEVSLPANSVTNLSWI